MKFINIATGCIFLLGVASSCMNVGSSVDKDPEIGPNGIPKSFHWKTDQEISLTVYPDDQYNSRYFYTIEVFSANPVLEEEASLISGTKANTNHPFQGKVVVPTLTEKLYIRQTDPYGRKRIFSYDVAPEMVCRLGIQLEGKQTSLQAAPIFPTIDYTIPSDATPITNGNQIQPGGIYQIKSGVSVSISSLPGGGNFSLYIAGNALLTNGTTLQNNAKIFVVKGGSFTSDNNTTLQCVGNAQIAISEEGVFGNSSKLNLTLSNESTFYNSGESQVNTLTLHSNGSLYNNGEALLKDIVATNATNILYNFGDMEIDNKLSLTNAKLYNACKIEIAQLNTNGANIELASGSILECDNFSAEGLQMKLDAQAILRAKKIQFSSYLSYVTGSEVEYGLIEADRIILGGSKSVVYSGSLEIACNFHTENPKWNTLYELIPPACFAEGKPSVEIPSDDCNKDSGNTNPGETTNPDEDDEYEEVATLSYTYLFEDIWPYFGDADMNDLVFDLTLSNHKKANKTLGFSYKITLRAVGGTEKINLAFQLDQVLSENVPGAESGQKYAVLDVIEDPKALFGVSADELVNTVEYNRDPIVIEGKITFNQPIEENINFENLNVFIHYPSKNYNGKRVEIHLPYYNGTNKAANEAACVNYLYKPQNAIKLKFANYMWGLRIPSDGNFSYAKEFICIDDAYPDFHQWATSGGTQAQDWYYNSKRENIIIPY